MLQEVSEREYIEQTEINGAIEKLMKGQVDSQQELRLDEKFASNSQPTYGQTSPYISYTYPIADRFATALKVIRVLYKQDLIQIKDIPQFLDLVDEIAKVL